MNLLFYTAWFRPRLDRDVAMYLCEGLRARGHNIVTIIGPGDLIDDDDGFAENCKSRGFRYLDIHKDFILPKNRWIETMKSDPGRRQAFLDWLEPLRSLDIDLGVLYFSTWIPSEMTAISKGGFINFHPGPLPHVRGFLPEDWAMLKSYRRFGGTVHRVEPDIDTGPILNLTRPAPLWYWDTPDSLMQKIAEYGLPDILDTIDALARGGVKEKKQDLGIGVDASYANVYPYSYIDWRKDTAKTLQTKFQVFRGQAHRIVLKAEIEGIMYEILDWEVHQLKVRGKPGQVLATNGNHLFIKTRSCVAVITSLTVFKRDPNALKHMDRKNMHSIVVTPARYRSPMYTRPWIKAFLNKK